jgi:hypothetical protein
MQLVLCPGCLTLEKVFGILNLIGIFIIAGSIPGSGSIAWKKFHFKAS